MNKNRFSSLLLITSIIVFSIFAAPVLSSKKTKHLNVIYLHEQKKTVRSNEDHLQQFSSMGDVVLDFYADWCNPCKRMSPLIDATAVNLPHITFIKINRDFFMDLANTFNISSIPTLVFLRNGKEIGRYDGKPLTKEELKKLIATIYT